ncbi:PCSK5 [Mytilus coruscus]|uniref:PCSK5 n=1 Tax=Mytilus coruscus TaxID=42192 RepID=A0A6J8EST7_MYTCO|nr:PCSK5 [Mytilus coruscus]
MDIGVDNSTNAWYAEVCTPALAAAYGGSQDDRYLTTTTTSSGCKSDGIQGTSYATSIASDIVALTLEANIVTSIINTCTYDIEKGIINICTYDIVKVSQVLGFGLMDAEAMVNYGTNWTTVPTQQNCISSTSSPALRTSISKNNQTNSEESGPSYINEIPSDHHDLDMTMIDHMI